MEEKTQKLAKMLTDIAIILETFDIKHWALWVSSDANKLRNGDVTAISHFLNAFGGMGSINDLYICPQNGHRITDSEVQTVNDGLRRSLSEAWALATRLSRELEL